MAFLGYKKKKIKRSKNWHFCKGVNPWFWSKNGRFFKIFFFGQFRPGMCLLRYFRAKIRLSRLFKQKVPKVEKLTFPQTVNPWFWSKNGHFSKFFFQEIQDRKMSFTIFQSDKTLLKAIKTSSPKSRKIDIFPKGLTHAFGPKMAIFQPFLIYEKQARKMSFTIF